MSAIAIDWSGNEKNPKGKIWVAVCEQGKLIDVVPPDTREEAIQYMLDRLKRDPDAVAGLDFAFSMPKWFLQKKRISRAVDFWPLVKREGKGWLERCEPPFWGKSGKKKPEGDEPLRETEKEVGSLLKGEPKSVFQVCGNGAVGTGSIRGMPFLTQIREAGVAVWPFDAPSRPLVVEIYPRLFTGGEVKKSNPKERKAHLDKYYPTLCEYGRGLATGSDDAFDAIVSALELEKSLAEHPIPLANDEDSQIEGRIWKWKSE